MIWNTSGEAKVDKFDIFVLVQKDVFQFDVPVSNTFRVAVLKRDQNLLEDSSAFFFVELLVDDFF